MSIQNTTQTDFTVCSTPECAKTAQSILSFVDFNVDPCSDFYQYTCGSWLNKTTIAEDRTSAGTLETSTDVNTDIMHAILEGSYQDIYSHLFSTADGFHTDDQAKADKENFDTMKNYYDLCMNENKTNSLGPTPIYEIIAMVENNLFPVKDNNSTMIDKNATLWMSQTLAFLNKYDISTLNSISVGADDKRPDWNAIWFDQAELGLPSREYYSDPTAISKYKTGLEDILYKVLGDYSNNTQDADMRRLQSNKTGFGLWTKEKITASVDRYIAFETQLANISLKNDELQDPVKMYNPIKLEDFQAQNPTIDWTSILKALVSDDITIPDTIIVRTPEYYQRLNGLLSNGTVSLSTLQEYFIIQYVISRTYALDRESRAATQKMNGAISSGTSIEQARWRVCVGYTSKIFKNTMGRYYTLRKFGGENERKKAEELLTTIHQAWLDRLPNIEWLDEQTREKAIEKVNLIKHKVALSIVSPDLRQPNSIKEFNQGLYVNENSFLATENGASAFYASKTWNKIGKEIDKDEWYMSPQTVNAYYSPNENEIVIPAGIMQAPIYDAEQPEYLNYGGIGMVIGHELTHAFDSSGRKYDGNGNLVDWWTNATSAKFEEKTQCFIDQYSKFNISGPDSKTVNVNGKLTLGENLADNGGISASLSAYHSFLKSANHTDAQQRLPGLEKFSPEALFFINFGRLWCRKQRPELALRLVLTDEHSPSIARVNGVAQNSAEFAKVFNCPAGSPMNPVNK
ncbi:hypothetical protein CU098_002675, partial [Rhizopus stolonifer]